MRALNNYVVCEVRKKEAEKTTKAGIIVPISGESITTNTGDKVGTLNEFVVKEVGEKVEANIRKGDVVIINPWTAQMFENNETSYIAVPESEIKVVL